MKSRRSFAVCVCAALALCLPFAAFAQGKIEKPKVSIAVGGKTQFYYLPVTIAEATIAQTWGELFLAAGRMPPQVGSASASDYRDDKRML